MKNAKANIACQLPKKPARLHHGNLRKRTGRKNRDLRILSLRDSLYFSKLTQLKRLFNYLSDYKAPAYVESYHRLTIWARDNGVVTLVNASMDDTKTGA